MKKIAFYVVILFFLQCTKQSKLPDNLNFSIKDAIDSFDFSNGEFIRCYYGDTVTVKVTFNDYELEQIKKWYVENRLYEIKESYHPDKTLNSLPAHALQVVLNINNKEITVFYDASYGVKDYFRVKRIKKFIENIDSLLHEKEEVKRLPRTDITFF